MKKTSETVVFFGSGPVAAKSLELLAENFSIEAVVTKPKPAHHKGSFPVLELAERLNLRVLPVSNKRETDELFAAKSVNSRLGVLIDFGIIVSQQVIDCFPLGIVNSHFSLLPEWRGADPITFAILSGQKRTGVSLMLLVEKMDEGPLLAFGLQEITDQTTTPELTEQLIGLSDGLLRAEIPRYLAGDVKFTSQEQVSKLMPNYPTQPSYSRKLTKEDGVLDWNKSAEQLEREIRAFVDWPKSRTTLGGSDVIITKAHVVEITANPGQLILRAGGLIICTQHNALTIDRLKPAGKPEMSAQGFLAGYGKRISEKS